MLVHVSLVGSLLFVSKFPLYGYVTFCLSIHQLIDTWTVSRLKLLMKNAAENTCILHCVCFQFP